jgi:hypothetical protein
MQLVPVFKQVQLTDDAVKAASPAVKATVGQKQQASFVTPPPQVLTRDVFELALKPDVTPQASPNTLLEAAKVQEAVQSASLMRPFLQLAQWLGGDSMADGLVKSVSHMLLPSRKQPSAQTVL